LSSAVERRYEMRRTSSFLTVLSTALLCTALAIAGCGTEEGTRPGGGDAQGKVDQANAALEDILYELINGAPPASPQDVDFSPAYDLYMEALAADPDHPGANFGAGLLEILMLTQDPEVQEFFARLAAFVEAGDYFKAPSGAEAGLLPPAPAFDLRKVELPVSLPVRMTRAYYYSAFQQDPTVDELQQICLNEVLPRIETALARLAKVAEHPDFTFTVTPRMQGDPNEDSLEIDMTEVRATMAALDVLRAALYQFTAYDFNFEEYTGEEMQRKLSRGSSFGTLHPEGASRMQSALSAWFDAVDDLEAAIDFLENETDDQSDDVIKVDPYDGITQAELDSVKAYIPKVRKMLESSETITADWDGKNETPEEPVEISLHAMYSSPVQDLKELLPPYTVSLDTQPVSAHWKHLDTLVVGSFTVPEEGFYVWQRSAHYFEGGLESSSFNANITVPEWDAAWLVLGGIAESARDAYLNASYSKFLTAGAHTDTCYMSIDYEDYSEARYVPVITWDADSYQDWIFPDPTFGGVFPGMTDSEFKRIFGITEEAWTKSITLYIWGL